MSKTQPRTDLQLSLFDSAKTGGDATAPAPGSLDISSSLRAALRQSVKASPLSRFGIAARMSELLDRELSVAQLDAWTCTSKEGTHRLPADFIPAVVLACGDASVIRLLAERCLGVFVESAERLSLELGRLDKLEAQIRDRRREIAKLMKA